MGKFVLFDIDYTLFDTKSFMDSNLTDFQNFDEVSGVLDELAKVAKLGIFSKGEKDFQHNKLLNTQIMKHFSEEDIHVAEDKEQVLEEILKKYSDSKIFLVDDKINILKVAKEISPKVYTIWIKRGPFVEIMKDIDYVPDATVNDLKKIVSLVSRTN